MRTAGTAEDDAEAAGTDDVSDDADDPVVAVI